MFPFSAFVLFMLIAVFLALSLIFSNGSAITSSTALPWSPTSGATVVPIQKIPRWIRM